MQNTSTLHRLYRHVWSADREVRRAFPPDCLSRVEQAVAASERAHAGELRVVVEGGLGWAVLREAVDRPDYARARAIALFAELGVWDTAQNCGVLIYLLMAEHRLEIVADRGINEKVEAAAWQRIVDEAAGQFKAGAFEQGLLGAIAAVDALLRQHFPVQPGDIDELPNRPVIL